MIHRLMIRDYMGIALREIELPHGGAIFEGANGKGKTSILKAIRAALAAQGIGTDAIRKGADASEILIDLDEVTVRRAITKSGSSLKVSDANGVEIKKPQTFLSALLGVAPLDPLDVVFERDPRKRRATILAALPCAVTRELLGQWMVPSLLADVDRYLGSGWEREHGLEVVARLRAALYAQRTTANRAVEIAIVDHQAALAKAAQAEVDLRNHLANAFLADAPAAKDAAASLAEAKATVLDVQARRRAHEQAAARVQSTTDAIAAKRRGAQASRGLALQVGPTAQQIDEATESVVVARAALEAADAAIDALRAKMVIAERDKAEAKAVVEHAEATAADLEARFEKAQQHTRDATQADADAAALEQAVGALDDAPGPEDVAHAQLDVTAAEAMVAAAMSNAELGLQRVRVEEMTTRRAAAEKAAADIDAAVKRLTDDAPAALLRASSGVDGLRLDGDAITLDGVSLDSLSSAEQLEFAIDIARRLNAKSKLIVVDGLERLDDEHLPAFVAAATRDGFQLLATRVAKGEVSMTPIAEGGA